MGYRRDDFARRQPSRRRSDHRGRPLLSVAGSRFNPVAVPSTSSPLTLSPFSSVKLWRSHQCATNHISIQMTIPLLHCSVSRSRLHCSVSKVCNMIRDCWMLLVLSRKLRLPCNNSSSVFIQPLQKVGVTDGH